MWNYDIGSDVPSVAISADGNTIVAVTGARLYVFNLTQGTPLWTDQIGGVTYGRSVDITLDGKYIVASCKGVFYYHKNSSNPIWKYETNEIYTSVKISSQGDYIVAGTDSSTAEENSGNVYFFKNSSSTPFWHYFSDFRVKSVAISSDGKYVVAACRSLKFFDRDKSSPEEFNLDAITGTPDIDGNITLYWNPSRYADNYSVYYINETAYYKYMVSTLIENGLQSLNYSLSDLVDGYYTFKVVAYNRFGSCSSNLIIIQVKFPYILSLIYFISSSLNSYNFLFNF